MSKRNKLDKKAAAENHNKKRDETEAKLERRVMSIKELLFYWFVLLVAKFHGAEVSVKKKVVK